jgi:single-strand DNA-binding protein
MNIVIMIGRIATKNDPILSKTPSGASVMTFNLAVEEPQSREDKLAGKDKKTNFVPIILWHEKADFVHKYCKKGSLIAVEGRNVLREWNDKATGEIRKTVEVVVEKIQKLDWEKKTLAPSPNDSDAPIVRKDKASPSPAAPIAQSVEVDASLLDDPFAGEKV